MKTTKIILLILCGVALIAFSCKKPCDIVIEIPSDVKPIDWNNYNDVYTVFWNILKNDCVGSGFPTGDTVKVFGIIDRFDYRFSGELSTFELIGEREYEDNFIYDYLYKESGYLFPSVNVLCYLIADELQSIIDSIDVTHKKCYIKGELYTGGLETEMATRNCCFTVPGVRLYSISDIYFEEEE